VRAAVLAGAAVVADVALDPLHRHVPLCPLHASTGLWCPLCGGLRAVDALAHGDVLAALHLNLLVVFGAPVAVAWWLDTVLRERRGSSTRRVPRVAYVALVGAALVFGVVRNLPFAQTLRG
jgi:hypothetical protein